MPITIYHNPACGTSRNVLALLRACGVEPRIVEYLKEPPPPADLADLASRTGHPLRDLLREKGTPFAELGLGDPQRSDRDLLAAIAAHPILFNRPLVVSDIAVKLCRPSDVALDLLSDIPRARILKEEGVPFLKDAPISADDAGFIAALAADALPTDDLIVPGRRFFVYATLDGEVVGHGGLEWCGDDVLIRSIVVPPAARRLGIGRNLVPLLLYRAYEQGARRAWLLTQTAAPFFAKLGFKEVPRTEAPAAVLASRQAASLCPASATLMSRRIGA